MTQSYINVNDEKKKPKEVKKQGVTIDVKSLDLEQLCKNVSICKYFVLKVFNISWYHSDILHICLNQQYR